MDAIEIESKFISRHLHTKGGTFWFFNKYHFGKPCDNFYKLESITFDKLDNKLIIQTSYPTLTIWNPSLITESTGYSGHVIKIKTCDKMLLEYVYKNEHYYSEFICSKDSIVVNSNMQHYTTFYDFSYIIDNVVEFGE